jgi:hypothetical protein
MFFGLLEPDPLVRGTAPDLTPAPGLHKCVELTEICIQIKILTQNFSKKFNF